MSLGEQRTSRRDLLRKGAVGGIGLAGLGSLSGIADISRAFAAEAAQHSEAGMGPLTAAAKKEGHLNVITLPLSGWADYGEIMSKFQSTYGIKITDANPLGSSANEISAIQTLKGQGRAPDVIDVSYSWADKALKLGLLTPYKVSTWDTIPASAKEPSGLYYGDYWGIPGFLTNNSVVKQAPKEWADLLSPTLKNMVALGGDPRTAGEAFGAVFGAALANGGSLNNIQPGIDFFAKVKKAGNWNPTLAQAANLAKGAVGVAIRWDYLLLGMRDDYKGNPSVTIHIPSNGHYAGLYFQAISKSAPNPNAAKLWQEYLYSDAGQLMFLKGYTHPVRYADLVKRNKVPAALAALLPPASSYTNVQFPTLAQITAAQKVLADQWGPKVAGS